MAGGHRACAARSVLDGSERGARLERDGPHREDAEGAGLIDQMADNFGFAPDLIGTRGSGATAVRTGLYRRSHRDPEYLAKKKMIIWCFAAREFTEADEWTQLPVAP